MSLDEDRRAVRNILKASRAVEGRQGSPFAVDVGEALQTLARLFPRWTSAEDLAQDARALNALSRVLQVQEGRLRYEAALFMADPEGLVEKLGRFRAGDLADLFVSTWRPLVELEQMTTEALALAYRYWTALPPWEGRWPRGGRPRPAGPPALSEEEMAALGILSREGFLHYLGELWEELKADGPMDYWEFLGEGDLEAVVRRAYGVSFLVTYGYADLDRGEGTMTLTARPERKGREGNESLPVVLEGRP